jgi:hypothetical protein
MSKTLGSGNMLFIGLLMNFFFFLGNRVGVFATLTNSYAVVAIGGSENFYRLDSSFFATGLVANFRGKKKVSLKPNCKTLFPFAMLQSAEHESLDD